MNFLSLGSNDIDLTNEQSASKLASIKKKYSIIFTSAITPDKGKDEFCYLKNINMIVNFFKFFKKEYINHFFYISSDAVYNLDSKLINENTPTTPNDLYGLMHLTREKIIENYVPEKKRTIFRLTLIYGKGDTHNSYGPNRFVKDAVLTNKITIFNEGKDTRDFIFINDVINILFIFIKKNFYGIFNLATGKSYSFVRVSKILKKYYDKNIQIIKIDNSNKITHRKFLITNLKKKILNYKFSNFELNLKSYLGK